MSIFMRAFFCLVLLLAGNAVLGAEVYVNGVKADGLTNAEFNGCTVKFDDKGVIHITAPGVKILAEGAGAESNKLSEQYFVALTLSQGSTVPVKIVVNGLDAEALRPGEKTKITDITKFLRKGANKILLMATPEKNPLTVQVLIGTGKMSSGSIELSPSVDKQLPLGDKGLSEIFDLNAK